jgi:predicted anti-sigma-YlaC factor YlaD
MSERCAQNRAGSEHVTGLLSPYIDNRLDEAEQALVREHLDSCAECSADYSELRATQLLLKNLPQVPPPRAFTLTPEMVASRPGFWQRLFVPGNSPAYAFGSALAFVLASVVIISSFLGAKVDDTFSRIGSGLGGGVAAYDSAPDQNAGLKFVAAAPTETTAAAAWMIAESTPNNLTLPFAYSPNAQGTPAASSAGSAGVVAAEPTQATVAQGASVPVPPAGQAVTAVIPEEANPSGPPVIRATTDATTASAAANVPPVTADTPSANASTPDEAARKMANNNLQLHNGAAPTPDLHTANATSPPEANREGPSTVTILVVVSVVAGIALGAAALLAGRRR